MRIDIVQNEQSRPISLVLGQQVVGQGVQGLLESDVAQGAAPDAEHDQVVGPGPALLASCANAFQNFLGLTRERLLALCEDDTVLGVQLLWNMTTTMSQRVRFVLWQLERETIKRRQQEQASDQPAEDRAAEQQPSP